jgi:hypothetical protein
MAALAAAHRLYYPTIVEKFVGIKALIILVYLPTKIAIFVGS